MARGSFNMGLFDKGTVKMATGSFLASWQLTPKKGVKKKHIVNIQNEFVALGTPKFGEKRNLPARGLHAVPLVLPPIGVRSRVKGSRGQQTPARAVGYVR